MITKLFGSGDGQSDCWHYVEWMDLSIHPFRLSLNRMRPVRRIVFAPPFSSEQRAVCSTLTLHLKIKEHRALIIAKRTDSERRDNCFTSALKFKLNCEWKASTSICWTNKFCSNFESQSWDGSSNRETFSLYVVSTTMATTSTGIATDVNEHLIPRRKSAVDALTSVVEILKNTVKL